MINLHFFIPLSDFDTNAYALSGGQNISISNSDYEAECNQIIHQISRDQSVQPPMPKQRTFRKAKPRQKQIFEEFDQDKASQWSDFLFESRT